jgi:hypothetical protein
MELRHLESLLPSFMDELEKEAGLKDDLKIGTKRVLTTLKDTPRKAGEVARSAVLKAHSAPVVGKAIQMATDPINAPDIGHALSNITKMIGH